MLVHASKLGKWGQHSTAGAEPPSGPLQHSNGNAPHLKSQDAGGGVRAGCCVVHKRVAPVEHGVHILGDGGAQGHIVGLAGGQRSCQSSNSADASALKVLRA